MSDFKKGDRVTVAKDLEERELAGRHGIVMQPAKYYQGELAMDPMVLLDGADGLLAFAQEELVSEVSA